MAEIGSRAEAAFDRLSLGRDVAIALPSRHARVDAADRIRRALMQKPSVEAHPDIHPARFLAGSLDGFDVRLHLGVEGFVGHHNRSWSIQLIGAIEPTDRGSELRGIVRLGHPLVRGFLWLWRILVAALGVVFLLATVGGSPGGLLGVVVAVGMLAGGVALDRYGTRIGRDDARLMVDMLASTLG